MGISAVGRRSPERRERHPRAMARRRHFAADPRSLAEHRVTRSSHIHGTRNLHHFGYAHAMDDDAPRAADGRAPTTVDPSRAPLIQANGREYLVTINGSVFVALSLEQAETIAARTRS